jgi:hypothetical protein
MDGFKPIDERKSWQYFTVMKFSLVIIHVSVELKTNVLETSYVSEILDH